MEDLICLFPELKESIAEIERLDSEIQKTEDILKQYMSELIITESGEPLVIDLYEE